MAACSLLGAAAAAAAPRPNILFLFADDQRADTIAAHGNPHIRTPHLDRLVAEGFSFRGHYIFGGNSGAVCMPSRAMLMSGRTWFHVDHSLTNAPLFPELLRQQGYVTFGTGKWHNGEPSWLRCFQQGRSIFFGGMSDHLRVPVKDLGPDGKLTAQRSATQFSSELFADAAIDFLKRHDTNQPFFAYVAFTAPHDPRMPPEPIRDDYYRERPPPPANFLPQLPFDNGMMQDLRDENLAAWPRTEAVIRDQLAEYYGMITHLDGQVGRILDVLKATGQAGNTLIIYAADNGLALGSHGLLGKQSVFEHSMRVPLIFAGPGIPRGRSTQAFTYLHDLFPTVCDVLGVPAPPGLEGESLRPLWDGTRSQVRDSVFLPFLDLQRAVRDDRWKLIAYPKIGHLQLFDLETDPDERTNLVDRADSVVHVARLQQRMRAWQARVGDTLRLPATNRPPPAIDLTGRKREPDPWQPDWIVRKYFDSRPPVPTAGIESTRVFVSGEGGYHTYRIPALAVTPAATLLAFAEGRKAGRGDTGNIDLLLRRSVDGGSTWQAVQTIWDDGPNTCGNPCVVVDRTHGTIWLLLTWNRGEDTEAQIIGGRSRDTRRVLVTSSTDDGRTWASPQEITRDVKRKGWTWYATGPGGGIQIERGPFPGRLVIPCDHIEAETRKYFSHVIYSDDHGRSWRLGGSTPRDQVNECAVVELEGGRLLLNMRNYDPAQRARQQAISADGGLTWTDQRLVPELIEPICQASLWRHAWPTADRPGVILFANPAGTRRERFTIRASLDDGRTWTHHRLFDPRPSAYSCLASLPDGRVGVLYEAGDEGPYENMVFARFPLAWLGL